MKGRNHYFILLMERMLFISIALFGFLMAQLKPGLMFAALFFSVLFVGGYTAALTKNEYIGLLQLIPFLRVKFEEDKGLK